MVFNATFNNISQWRLELWCLMPLSTIYHNGVRVMVFNATFNNISQWRLELWCLMPLSTIYHNGG